ncbi:hypothetical protein GWP40_00670 [Treponema vincentii]|uniref:hypothetical protein n=1 Tax=Treponema vincentii TaxID=69710 RepID=UPI001BB072CE|nr:hypothetical protein [Treponema vincentii]QUY17093.1 hypothetical protein GWP40_00670 [Treponema vincentii]
MLLSVHTAVMENGACLETANNDLFKAAAMRFSVRLLSRSSAPVQVSVTGSRIQCSGKQEGLLCSSS